MQDGGHLAVGVELHTDAALVLFAGQKGVLACLAQTVACGNDDGDVLAALGLGHGRLVGGLEGQHDNVLAGLLALNELEGCEHDVVCLGSVQALLQLDEGVAHEPVDLGPCLNDFGGSQVAQVSGDCLEEVLVDGGVLFFLQAQGCVLVCNAGEDLIGVGVRILNDVGGEHGDGACQCLGLGTFELGGAGEHAVHQVGASGEHSTVEVGGDVVNALSNNGQRCLNNGAGLFGEHRCVPSSCVVTSVVVVTPLMWVMRGVHSDSSVGDRVFTKHPYRSILRGVCAECRSCPEGYLALQMLLMVHPDSKREPSVTLYIFSTVFEFAG